MFNFTSVSMTTQILRIAISSIATVEERENKRRKKLAANASETHILQQT